ncbi:hypothetical protein [Winogradskyella costae]|uniref:hypothetical protein n=1 Tax=Winogradskyella costae TaxID=2697008 RepID=UPI0015CE00A8|nr:hypothetical protein [Winogradskyella costae]
MGKIKIKILIFIGLIISCNSNKIEFGNTELSQKIELMNISDLMQNPTGFDNDTLKIVGELHLDLENKGIFSKSEKIWINSFKPATELDSVWKRINGKKVEIIGLYKAGKTGHLGLYNGQLKEIYYIKTK